MVTVNEIENAVAYLNHDDLSKFRAWFEKYDARQWDAEFARDAKEGKIDKVAEDAISDFKKGKCSKL